MNRKILKQQKHILTKAIIQITKLHLKLQLKEQKKSKCTLSIQIKQVSLKVIGQNVTLVKETKLQNIPRILLQLDFYKAFNTIEWIFIQMMISFFSFGHDIQCWLSTFYTRSATAVLNKGFCTNYFQLSSGSVQRKLCPTARGQWILGSGQ